MSRSVSVRFFVPASPDSMRWNRRPSLEGGYAAQGDPLTHAAQPVQEGDGNVKKRRWVATASPAVAALVAGLLGATASIAHAQQPHYYILIGGTCDGNAAVCNLA